MCVGTILCQIGLGSCNRFRVVTCWLIFDSRKSYLTHRLGKSGSRGRGWSIRGNFSQKSCVYFLYSQYTFGVIWLLRNFISGNSAAKLLRPLMTLTWTSDCGVHARCCCSVNETVYVLYTCITCMYGIYTYVHKHLCVYGYVYSDTCVFRRIHMHVHIFIAACRFECSDEYAHTCSCIDVYIDVYIYIYTCILMMYMCTDNTYIWYA